MSSTGHLSELDMLRGQVADLLRELAERDRVTQDLREQSDLFRAIVEGTAAVTGEKFFSALVTHLTSTLHIKYAIIGEVQGDRIKKIRTLAVSAGGTLADNFEYELAHTPCATALTQTVACFARDLQDTFPQFQRLADLGAESYCGVPFWTKSGAVIGLLIVMDTKPLEHSDDLQSLLGVFAPRIAAEFERSRAEQEHAEALADLHNVMEMAPDIMFTLDTQGNMVKWNRRVREVTGYSPEELLNMPALAFVPPEEHIPTAAAIQRAFTDGYAELEGHLLTKDHRLIPYHWTGALLKSSHGEPIGITGIGRDVSDKKRAEEALHKSEQRFALAVEGSNDILWDAHRLPGEPWYAPQTPIWWSPRVRKLLGLQESDSFETFEQWAVRLHPDDKDRVFGQLTAHIEHRVPYDVEYRLRTNAGDYCWIRGRGQALWDEQGEPRRMSGSCQDITERKWADAVREELLARLQKISSQVPGVLYQFKLRPDGSSCFPYASERIREIYRVSPDEVQEDASKVFAILHPEDYDGVVASITKSAETMQAWQYEFRVKFLDGTVRWLYGNSIPQKEADGSILWHGFITDVTGRKQMEEALRASEDRFNLAVRGSSTGIWDWDLRTSKTYFSPLWKRMLGYEEHELRGEFFEWEKRLHPDDSERSLETVRAYLEGTTPQYELEHRLRHKDGSYRWVLARGVSLLDAEGNPYRMAGSHIDITELKQAQQALIERERQLRTVLDALPVGVWFTDRSGKPLLVNPMATQIWSNIKHIELQNPDSSVGWRETVEPATGPHRWALSHVLTTGVPSLNETLEIECLDGTKKTIKNSTVPVQDEAGIILGAIVLNEDITTLRQVQKALKLTQSSVDRAVEGFFWISPDARVMRVNEAACRMLEYTRDELTAMTVHNIDPNFPPEAWPTHWGELKEKGSLTFETQYWSKTGRVLDTEVTVNYLQHEGEEYCCAIMRDIGERKRVQAALRASEERYRSLYDETPIMYFTLATDGTILSVNRFGAEQLGYQVEELTGHSVLGLFHEDDKETVAANLSECLATLETTRHWEFRKVRKDGSIIWVRETGHVGQSSSGEAIVFVTCEDITERKQVEEELRKNHSLLSAIMDTASDFIYVKDLAGCYLLTNPALARFMGKPMEDVIGQTDYALLPPELAASCMTADRQVIATGVTVTQEEHGTVEGKTVVYLTTKAAYRDREGRVIGIIGMSRDISERKRAEEELRKSHAFIRQIIDTDPNFIFAKDREGRFTLVNKAVADAYGTTVDNLIGMTDADFNPNQEEVAFFRQKDLAVMDTLHELFLPEEVITDSGGRIRWLQTVKRPILDHEGRAIMVLGASTDITERKRMEETLRQRERDLRAAIEERERISQDLHDGILQSLFAVGLTLEASKSTMTPTARKTSGASLNQAIEQLNDVMREIRNFIAGLGSDLLEGKGLSMALQHMLALLTQNQAIRVRLAVEDRAAKAVSAEQSLHLFRVIQEAVSNCIRHGRAQEASVSLKMLKQGVRLSIRDNGRGFKQDAAKRTGHGLVNMAARAEKLGGRFSILSKVNEGTRIVLDLPNEAANVRS